MSPRPRRAFAYARQSVGSDEGIKQQRKALRKYAKRNRWEIVAEYADNDVSASRDRGDGTGWAQMLAGLAAGEASAVLCTEPSRLMRRLRDLVDLRDTGARLIATRKGLDSGTSGGGWMWSQLVVMAEHEIEQKEERRVPFARERHKAGHPTPGEPPYGYAWISAKDRGKKGRRWRVVPSEAAVVRWAFLRAAWEVERGPVDGAPVPNLAAMCRALNAKDRHTRSGAVWRSATLRRMLVNPVYAGLLQPRREDRLTLETSTGRERRGAETFDPADGTPGLWDALVTVETVTALRSALLDPRRTRNGGNVARRWPLSGLATCSTCSVPVRSGVDRQRKRVYRCPAGHLTRSGPLLDEFARALAIWRLSQPDAHGLVRPADGTDLDALDRERVDLTGRRDRLVDALAEGVLTREEIGPRLDDVRARLADLEERWGRAVKPSPLSGLLGADDVAARWDALPATAQHAALGALLRVQLEPVGKGVRARTFDDLAGSVLVEWVESDAVEQAARAHHERAQAAWLAGEFPTLSDALDATEDDWQTYPTRLPVPTPADLASIVPRFVGGLGDDTRGTLGAALSRAEPTTEP
ncbi:recombinase family protein [Agrococcus sp. SGAir0287]|uniref:recombinase family protein n=1 Tax=Agrococcus sp. SGAir0287 TaxID=2070347 RepID=UPI0010CD60AB|nr:recombinase family protein [Agrococcus sp. SGAir0287]QCR18583.1 hypothetical protein C1N71_03225 [Agrococcus sp. SGAir0287]